MKTLLPILLLSVLIANAQIDKPVTPEDLADRRNTAETNHKSELKVIRDAENHLKASLDTDDGSDPQKQAPLIHLDIMKCLANGDFARLVAELYSAAAIAASRLAQELEAKSQTSTVATASVSASALTQKLDETVHRAAELRAKPNLTDVDRIELDGLESLQKQLRDTLTVVQRIQQVSNDPAKYADAAQQMREREQMFRIKASEAEAHATVYNVQCVAHRIILVALAEDANRQQMLNRWDVLRGPASQIKLKVDSSGGLPTPTPAELDRARLLDERKEFMRIWSDPDALQKQLDHLKTLSSPSGSH